ncbi:divergent PAP2 family protein [Parablautia intestinalis]|jgi:acid phosphatase family membrane protein YuiD|uniref:divergent PAP2 family protein n=1 Tax=Parablautia intestinalis TaxID=2320100 RepID=UPI0023D43C84|nr:divergent PAP2 family protein [Parablautia intestinalis]MCI8614716.1 divergent PAP2 family protein [Lachnospiraceae bacterium]MDE7048995.1 divergent PAP2 family protein [Lachnospiraceae bacterium]
MDFITDLLQNQVFVSAALGWLVAQVLKTLIHLILTKQFVAERMVGGGGMPSSHSATVCALATSTGIKYGGGSFEFAITAMLAIIVMYDAMGVRRETGKQGRVLNEMMEVFMNMGKQISVEERLKEFVGHTPLQVLMGAILGTLIAVAVMGV